MTRNRVVFAITAAQLACLRDPDNTRRAGRGRQDPRDRLADKGMLRAINLGMRADQGPRYERTMRGDHLLRALDGVKLES